MPNESERDIQSTQSEKASYSMSNIPLGRRYINISTDVYEITHDKLLNILNSHNSRVGSRVGWQPPLLFLASLVLTLVTSEFKAKASLSKDTWEAIYIIITAMSVLWFLWSSVVAIINWKGTTTQSLIDKIKDSRSP